MSTPTRIDVVDDKDVKIVKFLDHSIFDDRTVRESMEQLNASLPSAGEPIKLIVDFSGVDIISSSLLGKLIILQRRVDNSKGKMRLCEMSRNVEGVFRTANLDRLFTIDRDRRESLDRF